MGLKISTDTLVNKYCFDWSFHFIQCVSEIQNTKAKQKTTDNTETDCCGAKNKTMGIEERNKQ